MLQQPDARPPPPPSFKSYEKSSMSGGLVTMIENLIADADAMIQEAVADEAASLTEYEGYVMQANEETRARNEQITHRRLELGKLEQFKLEEQQRLNETIIERDQLRQQDIDLYGVEGCEFLLKNYALRREMRVEEIKSLSETEVFIEKQIEHMKAMEETIRKASEQVESLKKEVPGGVQITGPNGESAVAKMGEPSEEAGL